jgi:hypothetical protein
MQSEFCLNLRNIYKRPELLSLKKYMKSPVAAKNVNLIRFLLIPIKPKKIKGNDNEYMISIFRASANKNIIVNIVFISRILRIYRLKQVGLK